MHRRQFLYASGLLSAGLLWQRSASAFFRSAAYEIRPLRGNVSIFTERGGTIAFLESKEGWLVIDAQFPDTSKHLVDELQKKGTTPFKYLLNTHHHGDHTSGNIAYKGLVEQVLAHENSLANQKRVAEKANTLDKQLLPTLSFADEMKIKLGDEKINAYYFGPGHTNGDAVYHFQKANIMHLGDLLFNKRHPFVDRSAGASMRNWIEALDGALKKADKSTLFVFGHSLNPGEETGTAENIKKFQDYLAKTLAFAESEIKRGVSKEEFIKNTAIPGVTEWSGQGIERPLTAAYEELIG